MSNVQKLWDIVFQFGYVVRYGKLDGLQCWNKIKPILSSVTPDCEWSMENIRSIYFHMKTEFNISENKFDYENNNIWESYHFYLQHSRIPYINKDDNKLVRLMQIAYNAGQYEYEKTQFDYGDEMNKYYVDNNLASMATYMGNDNLLKIDKIINNDLIKNISEITHHNAGHNLLKYIFMGVIMLLSIIIL